MEKKNSVPIREIFVNNLKFYRKQKGLSQERLSHEIGMSMAYINQVENKGSWPQPEIVDKIAGILEIAPSELFSTEASPGNVRLFSKEEYIRSVSISLFENLKGFIGDEIRKSVESEQLYAKRMDSACREKFEVADS